MLTLAEDHEDLTKTLTLIGYDPASPLVQAILAVHVTLSSYDLTAEQRSVALDLLSIKGRAGLLELPQLSESSWRDFDYGNVKQGDFVRVKRDAYDSVSGAKHNGLVGVMTFAKNHTCSVQYIGLASDNTMKHSMDKLESLKRSVQ